MCGICCILSTSSQASTSLHSKLLSNLKKRGPDLSAAIENRALCLQTSLKQGCISQAGQSDNDDERRNGRSCEEPLKLDSLDHSDLDRNNTWTSLEGREKEHGLQERRTGSPNCLPDGHETRIKSTEELVHSSEEEEESIHRGSAKTKLHSHCRCQSVYGSFFGQVLHLRGYPTQQPVEDELGNVLLWNGEIFDGIEVNGQNDTSVLSRLLGDARSSDDLVKVMGAIRGPWSLIYWQERNCRLWFGRDFFGRRSLLWLGDQSGATATFGLSSVAHKTEPGIPAASEWKEVPACGIFCLDVSSLGSTSCQERSAEITWYPWQHASPEHPIPPSSVESWTNQESSTVDATLTSSESSSKAVTVSEEDSAVKPFEDVLKCVVGECRLGNRIPSLNMQLPEQTGQSDSDAGDGVLHASAEVQEKADELIRVLGEAVRKRVTDVPLRAKPLQNNPAQQFQHLPGSDDGLHVKPCLSNMGGSLREGGGDCEAAHRKEAERTKSKYENHLDNGGHEDMERGQTKSGHDASIQSSPTDSFHGRHENNPVRTSNPSLQSNDRCQSSMDDSWMTDSHGAVSYVHAENVCERDGDTPAFNTSSSSAVCCPHSPRKEMESSRVGLLFSGGLDSIVLAALADRYVPEGEPIDLFNVAFELRTGVQQTKGKDKKKTSPGVQKKSFDVPDRLTGRAGFGELHTLNPCRKWNFVEIDVTLEELQTLRSEHLCHLIYPQDTVLDDSIGCAIWFAARGRGKLFTHDPLLGEQVEESYTSPAKVVLVGMGADEQLAGYSRHRSKFKSDGWQGLLEEIKMEVDRISARNLGRDDRVISDHGRESRLPYLDEDVVSYLNSLPINHKADLNLPRGVGEKILLRVAAQQLGLGASSKLPKRAIQFGSRIAKLENNREKASDRCNRLEQQVD